MSTFRKAIRTHGPLRGASFMLREFAGHPFAPLPNGLHARTRSTDLATYRQIFVRRDYDLSRWPPYQRHLDGIYRAIVAAGKIPVIIDAGANAGYSPIWFATTFPDATVLAVEPDPANMRVLRRNVAGFANIVPVEAAVWDVPAKVEVMQPDAGSWAMRFDAADDGIPTITVPELLRRDARYVPFIAKIDIEGAETKLFRSNTAWADDFPLVTFEPHDPLYDWLGAWQGSGHSFYSVLSRRPREYLTRGENVFAFRHPEGVAAD